MGLLDDIRKLRERAETLNNNFKSPLSDPGANSQKLYNNRFQNKQNPPKASTRKTFTNLSEPNEYINSKQAEDLNTLLKPIGAKDKLGVQNNFFKKAILESQQNKESELRNSFNNSFITKILLLTCTALIIFMLFKLENSSFNQSDNAKIRLKDLSSKTVPNDNKAYYLSHGLAICSGSFANYEDAKLQLNRIKKITEQDSKIIQTGDYYTIQIGDYYFNKDDAFYVFSELSAMGILDISIRAL